MNTLSRGKQKIENGHNAVLPKVAADPQARIGCKGKKKSWYGEREHVSVDMQSVLVHKVVTTTANRPDAQGQPRVWPTPGVIDRDKDYGMAPGIRRPHTGVVIFRPSQRTPSRP